MGKKYPKAKSGPSTDRTVPHNGFIMGSGNTKGGYNDAKANAHDGIISGGSITSKRASPTDINRLSTDRTDGKI